jgi:hypothetical protein
VQNQKVTQRVSFDISNERFQLDWNLGNLVAFKNFKMATFFKMAVIVLKTIMTFYKGKKGGDAG